MMQHSTHVHYCYLLNSFTMPPICYLLKAICAVRTYMETTIAATMCSETSFRTKWYLFWTWGQRCYFGDCPRFLGTVGTYEHLPFVACSRCCQRKATGNCTVDADYIVMLNQLMSCSWHLAWDQISATPPSMSY